MTTLERMARAIDPGTWMNLDGYRKRKGFSIEQAEELKRNNEAVQTSLRQAAAALNAIREPSLSMNEAVFELAMVPAGDFAPAWRAAIDAILSEAENGQ